MGNRESKRRAERHTRGYLFHLIHLNVKKEESETIEDVFTKLLCITGQQYCSLRREEKRLKRILPLFMIILIALQTLSIFTPKAKAAADPNPDITSVSYPSQIELGQSVSITVRGTNWGGESSKAYLSISFPNNPSLISASADFGTWGTYELGDTIWGGYGQYELTAEYLLVEGEDSSWIYGLEHFLTVEVTPTSLGTFVFNVKMVFRDNDQDRWIADPSTDGSESSYTDQQNEYVYRYTIAVYGDPYFYDSYWDNKVDVDGDGYYRSVTANWDADVDADANVDVYVEVEGRDSNNIMHFLESYGTYTIYDGQVDYKDLTVEVPHRDVWDLKLELYTWDGLIPELVDERWYYNVRMEPKRDDVPDNPDLTIRVDGTTKPDMSSGDPVAGEPIRLWFVLDNIGDGDALSSFTQYFYIDSSRVGEQTQNGLDAKTAVLIYHDTTQGPGYHEVRAEADVFDDVDEGNNEGNNNDIEVMWWKSPDLVVLNVWTVPSTLYEDQPFTIYVRTKNEGDADASETFHIELKIDGVPYATDDKNGLTVGTTNTWSVHHDDGLSATSHYLEVIVDIDDDVAEANKETGSGIGTGESNNWKRIDKNVEPLPEAFHYQGEEGGVRSKDYYCGPASLEMVFDYYSQDISQYEIADTARTDSRYDPPPGGTFRGDMVRAAHFSDMSWTQGTDEPAYTCNGYTSRKCGYSALYFSSGTPWLSELKTLVNDGYWVIVSMWSDDQHETGHYRVVVGYDESAGEMILHDPWDGPYIRFSDYEFTDLWSRGASWDSPQPYWGLFVHPWVVSVTVPESVGPATQFTVEATITYLCPEPFSAAYFQAMDGEATINLPPSFSLVDGEEPTKALGSLFAGTSSTASWLVLASSTSDTYNIDIFAQGVVSGSVGHRYDKDNNKIYPAYTYQDRIGGSGSSTFTVEIQDTTIHLASREDNAASSNLGSIEFDDLPYSIPRNITKTAGTYSIRYVNTNPSYIFDHWETTDRVSLADPNDESTAATISGDGNLTAIYKAAFVHGYSRIITQHTFHLGGLESLSLGIFGNSALISLCFGGILSFLKGKHRRRNKMVLVFVVLFGALLAVGIYAGVYNYNITIPSIGRLTAMKLRAYSDSQCSNNTSTIDWGPMLPASTNNVTLYLRNEGNIQITLSLSTSNWNPPETAFFATLNYNYTGQILNPGTVTEVEFTLNVSENIGDTDIEDFMFDIIICVH